MLEKIKNAIAYGIIGFFLGFFLSIFIGPVSMKIFPYILSNEHDRIQARYCFTTPRKNLDYQDFIACNDIEFRENLFLTGLTVAIIAAIYGFVKPKSQEIK
jgi:hypothetical protein